MALYWHSKLASHCFSDEIVTNIGEYSANLTRVINGIHNEEVRVQMLTYLPAFLERVPSKDTFKKRFQTVVLTKRTDLIQRKEKERKLIVGLRFESHDQCLTEIIDNVEVEGGDVSVVSGGYGANNFREKAGPHNMSKFMLCRRCGKGAHPVEVCPAKVGDRNSLGMVITASPEEFVQFTRQHFEQRSRMRGRGRFNGNPRGGFSAVGSRGGGRGSFTPRYNTVNTVGEDA